MKQLITKPFPYFVGIYSLEELITKESRVCVINILGSESRKVTPVSHEYSGGNVVAGVQYGRRGELETSIGNIPIYRSVRDVMENGHTFDIGAIYLPPAAVSQAVWELDRFNNHLKRIVIVTEKVPTRDSRNIRFICQEAGVDVIGANCLGVANAWDHVRVGGALGGDKPEEALKKGSIAIHSNSGNFTTTITEYLHTAGFGVSTVVSSGKDVYIHFALAEFLFAAQNDSRTKAVVVYVEPGGYYEKQALDWIRERRFSFNKPIIACVTGRWKKDLMRSCGHAGAMAGSGDDAETKSRWFDEYFGVPVFDPSNPKVSKKGVRVNTIQHIPEAMKAVFKKLGEKPDFKDCGDLSLKLWISDGFVQLPPRLNIPVVRAMLPYDERIKEINKQVGVRYLRQNMRNKSGVSKINPKTHVAELHGKPVIDLARNSFEVNLYFALAKVMPEKRHVQIMNLLLNLFLKTDEKEMEVIDRARENGCTPNAILSSQIVFIGNSPRLETIRQHTRWLIDLLRRFEIRDDTVSYPKALDEEVRKYLSDNKVATVSDILEELQKEVEILTEANPIFRLYHYIKKLSDKSEQFGLSSLDFLIACLGVDLFWTPMLEKRISRQTAEDAVSYIYILSRLVAFSVIDSNNPYWKNLVFLERPSLKSSFTDQIFKILFGRKPSRIELIELKYLLGLTITNGPGTLSAKGGKESVSARNHISMAFIGYLSNTGLAHGGNGFEAVEYLMDIFKESKLKDPGQKSKLLDLNAMANQAARIYAKYRIQQKETGKLNYRRIPCIGHPVFKGSAVNIDPREDFIRKELENKDIYNVFLDFYHHLVRELFREGATEQVFCVNVDAVLAVITMKLIWNDYQEKRLNIKQVQDLVFVLFLIGRSVGVSAEIADHRDRGLDMDCRTPQTEVSFVL
jgi:succinyl-CoA synthetase alpha subunit/citrate synthase